MNEREDLWPIMLRQLPARTSMADWRKRVDEHLTERAALDRQRAEQAEQATGGQDR